MSRSSITYKYTVDYNKMLIRLIIDMECLCYYMCLLHFNKVLNSLKKYIFGSRDPRFLGKAKILPTWLAIWLSVLQT